MYDGAWAQGERTGTGSLTTYANGVSQTMTGSFVKGKMEGYGSLDSNTTKYRGQFKDNNYNGQGKLEYTTGQVLEGTFKDGTMVQG